MNEEIEKALNRAKKMFNLAQNTSFEHEADTAMAMVHKILAKYNLSLKDVEDQKGQGFQPEHRDFNKYKMRWQKIVIRATSKLYGCYNFWHGGYDSASSYNVIIGRPHNIDIVIDMSSYIIKAIRKLEREAFNEAMVNGESTYKFKYSFYNGASNKIFQRVNWIIEDSKKSAEPGTSLVLVSETEASENYARHKFNLVASRGRSTRMSGNAYSKGQRAAEGISLNSQVGGNSNKQLRG